MAAVVAESIRIEWTPALRYVLRWADTCLIHAQRLSEWCGHAPVLEEDIALANMALDLLGQSRALLTHAATIEGRGRSEDELAFLREEDQFLNLTLAELPLRRASGPAPGGDFADTVVRNLLLASWLKLAWQRLEASADAELAAIAAKALKEARYHQRHAADWAVRLGDGTDESHGRMQAAVDSAWPYTAEMFLRDAVDEHAAATGLGPPRDALRGPWHDEVMPVLAEATLSAPPATAFFSTGTLGAHSEHMGYILAEMQSLQRRYPGGRW